MNRVSIYFYSGDIVAALQRYNDGCDQTYQTHNEVVRLIYDLRSANQQVDVYSFVSPERREHRIADGVRVVCLGANDYDAKSLLQSAVAEDNADAIVAHFPNLELLRAVASTNSRAIAVMAHSYNRSGPRSTLARWKTVSLLNNPRFDLVANHCLPATKQLAEIGVKRDKLIAWDVSHPFDPESSKPKQLTARRRFEAVYAGAIIEDKGIAELIRAVGLLREQGIEVHCSLAGLGDIDAMQTLAATIGVSDLFSFVRLIGNTEVFNMMVAADLVVLPSRTRYPEGFPLSMFEAIASRTPIVCSNHPMFREVMIDGRNASLFPAGNYRALAFAMQRILTSPPLYSALSANASSTWEALKGPADWRTLIFKWVVEGHSSPWIRDHMLTAAKQ